MISYRRWLWLLLLLPMLASCGKEPLYQEQGYVFGTLVEVSIYGADEARARDAVANVMQEFQRLHNLLHAWKPSELSTLNAAIAQGKSTPVSPELAAMLQDAAQLSAQSRGLFNPAIGGLVQQWGFHADEFKAVLPDERRVAALVKANPQMSDLSLLPSHLGGAPKVGNPLGAKAPAELTQGRGERGASTGSSLSPTPSPAGGRGEIIVSSRNRAVQLDLGGYAKGYALDRAADILHQMNINNALVNIGGNVMALGSHGNRPWRVGIQHPRKPGPLATLELHDGEAIGTSGDYQRYFELDGKRYCHLIDPRTGQPVQGVHAVTVLTRGLHAGLMSDVASKPLFIAGTAGWLDAANTMRLTEALLIDAAGVAHLTPGMQKRLEFTDASTRRVVEP